MDKDFLSYIQTRINRIKGCWIWDDWLDRDGYSRVAYDRKIYVGHRVIYKALVGDIPKGLVLDHLCQNKACVNPEHLEPVTNAENIRRRTALKTHCKNGHEFDGKNTYVPSTRYERICRICDQARQRKWRLKNA